jgi:hypothetical protein
MSLTLLAAVALGALALSGCRPFRTLPEAMADIGDGSARTRRYAAQDLRAYARAHALPPDTAPRLFWLLAGEPDVDARIRFVEALGAIGGPQVVDGLLWRLALESDRDVRDAIYEALAESGDLRVEPMLRAYAQTTDHFEQRSRGELYRTLITRSGRFGRYPELPADWPYGTQGFPEPVHGGAVWIEGAPAPSRFTVKGEAGVTVRSLFDNALVAFEFDTVLAGRTGSGIWGARFGTFQGALTSGLGASFLHLGPSWEMPTEYVRPSLQLRLGWLSIARNTDRGEGIEDFTLGGRIGLAIDLWRHSYDHAFSLSLAGDLDSVLGGPMIPGGSAALGGRF